MGAYHTIDLELNRKFTLMKQHWDFIALDRVGEGKLNSRPVGSSRICVDEA